MTPKGCPIRDIAPDLELNQRLSQFMQYKALASAGAPEYLQQRLLEAAELENDTDTLIQLESIYARHQRLEAEKEMRQRRGRK